MTGGTRPVAQGATGGVALVTGATGFIGAHLCRALADQGWEVHGTSRQGASSRRRLTPEPHWHQLDLAEAEAVDALIDGVRPQAVFHLASHVVGRRDRELVRSTFAANLASTVHLLDAVARVGGCGRFVQIGSLEEPDLDGPSAAPSSPYAAAKAGATGYARMFHHLYDVPVVLARLYMVYGPDQPDRAKLVPYVVQCLLEGRSPGISSGTRPVDWIHVADVVEALVRMATAEGIVGQQIDVGSGTLATVREVVDRLCAMVDPSLAPEVGAVADRRDEQVRVADAERSEKLLGWRPRFDLDGGLRDTLEWYRAEQA